MGLAIITQTLSGHLVIPIYASKPEQQKIKIMVLYSKQLHRARRRVCAEPREEYEILSLWSRNWRPRDSSLTRVLLSEGTEVPEADESALASLPSGDNERDAYRGDRVLSEGWRYVGDWYAPERHWSDERQGREEQEAARLVASGVGGVRGYLHFDGPGSPQGPRDPLEEYDSFGN